MAVFKFVISQGNKSYQIEKDQNDCIGLIGKKIGDSFSGDILGLNGYLLQIKGGSDKDGFPMRKDIDGVVRRRFLVSKGVGFKGYKRIKKKKKYIEGMRKRKMLRGNTISNDIVQINCKVIKEGTQKLDEIFKKESAEKVKEENK
jgi:small subunit ribosomal protein S6e